MRNRQFISSNCSLHRLYYLGRAQEDPSSLSAQPAEQVLIRKCNLAMTCTCHALCVELHLKLLGSARISGNKGCKIQIMGISTEAGECDWAGGNTWWCPCRAPEGKCLSNPLRSTNLLKSTRRPVSSTDWKPVSDWPGRSVAFAFFFFNQPAATWPQSCTVHVGWEQRDLPAIWMRQLSHLAAIRLPTSLTHLQLYEGS